MDSIAVLSRALNSDVQQLRVVSQNLANIHTNGYKRQAFALSSEPVGSSVPVSTPTVFDQGTLKFTGDKNHVAIDGAGFFQVRSGDNFYLTRRGEMNVDSSGKLQLLTGEYVQGEGGDITLEPGAFTFNDQGQLLQNDRVIDNVNIFKANTAQLNSLGGGLYSADPSAIEPLDKYHIRQGFLETSNVNQLNEMVKLMELTRHFESSSQVLQSYNTILEEAVTSIAEF